MSRRLSMLARMIADRKGATAVEMAMVMPVLLTLLVGVVKTSVTFNDYIEVSNAVRASGRVLASGRGSATPYTSALNTAYSAAPNLSKSKLAVTMIVNGTVCIADNSCQATLAAATGAAASVTATYPCDMDIIFVQLVRGCTITFQTAERIE